MEKVKSFVENEFSQANNSTQLSSTTSKSGAAKVIRVGNGKFRTLFDMQQEEA